ncbi:peptidase C1 [Pseudomonas cavernicola]|uniref:Peptidase C1 n=1 Tax=Pseudomonas cavernicola TaxID=2320866 RepID=A0A418XM45_9PSED|nr:C1 family peptidase [Pseudomonas cavernicola]RJG13549.1 peptidase C1 [Pseudomonas cavernicola]
MDMLLARNKSGDEVAELRKQLARALADDGRGFPGLAGGSDFDALTESAVRHWQSGIGIVADGLVGPYCQSLLGLRKLKDLAMALSVDAVKPLFPATKPSNIQRYLPYVAAALAAADLTDRPMILAALGTIRAETEGFVPISEFPSKFNTRPGMPPFSAYDGRAALGNTESGDGANFRGRGFVQLTGRHNYHVYSEKIDLDIEAQPDLANAPEVAAILLARFLADRASRIRTALASDNYRAARKEVNGGSHGLDRFSDVFRLAELIPQPTRARQVRGAAAKKAAAAPTPVARQLDASKDPVDLRDRTYMPPPLSLPDAFPSDDLIKEYLPRYTQSGLILDQGREGACTGFGLACVVNYLRWRKNGNGKVPESVSPRMLYNYARRYDEFAGEDYEGSSCRGALKGWHHHGVCLESDWPYDDQGTLPPKFGYATRATDNTLGVYYRIDIRSITDLQAAICEVGGIYVSAFTHDGWNQLPKPKGKVNGHGALPAIPFDGRPSQSGGHAFALVGFNATGFIVQNSWGITWGGGGFALLTYADWLANGMDAWVAALGVPGVMLGQLAAGRSTAIAAAAADSSQWWDEPKAYEHSVIFGNNGRIDRHLTQDELSRSLLYQACGLPDQWFRSQSGKTKRLVLYVHGGLNDQAAAIERARAMGRYFLGNGCYPLFIVWKTGVLESITDIITDMFQRERARAGGLRESIQDGADILLERGIGRPLARPIWSEMKENAEFASLPTRGGDKLVTALQNLARTWGDDLEVHLVGHSAGSIFLGHVIDLFAARGLETNVRSLHLYAPACTVQFANRHFAPHETLMQNLYLDILSDRNERDDSIGPYGKSLLYLVSNALEGDLRTPILGQANVLDPEYKGWDGSSSTGEALGKWRQAIQLAGLARRKQIDILDAGTVFSYRSDKPANRSNVTIKSTHGSFDNNVDVVSRTLKRITGTEPKQELKLPVDDLRGF